MSGWRRARVVLTGLVALTAVPARVRAATDPFSAYLEHVPAVLESLSSESSGSGAAAITTKTFTFASHDGANTVCFTWTTT
jgi:hypothetical protein